MKEHKRLIVKFPDEALGYFRGTGNTFPIRRDDNSKIRTIITNDDYLEVANQKFKFKIYKNGRFIAEPHDNTTKL